MTGYSTDPPLTEGTSPGIIDVAQTFAESDVTLRRAYTQVTAEAIELWKESGNPTTTADRPNDSASTSFGGFAGLRVNPNARLAAIQATISANGGSPVTAEARRTSDWKLLDVRDASGLSRGSTVTFRGPFESGTEVAIFLSTGNDSHGYYASPSFPYTSTDIDITDGDGGGASSGNAYAFTDVTADTGVAATSGSVTVEWPMPSDLYRWDAALFEQVLDGETVDVFIEENQSGTWTEVAGPIQRGDTIPAAPENNVRFRIDLSRANTANNPRLEAIYRRFVV